MSLTGLNESEFSSISVSNQIRLGISANNGDDGQFVKSDGENASWSDISSTDVLQQGTGISIDTTTDPDTISTNVKSLVLDGTAVSNSPQTFNPNADGGSQTITIGYVAGDGIEITPHNPPHLEVDTDETTITKNNGSDQIAVLKVPNQLTASAPLTLTGGYDGSSARSLTISNIANSDLQNSTISGVALGGNLANLTQGTNITFSSGTTYNGSSAITISSTDTDTTYQGDGSTISINTATTPDTISCLKVPHSLTAGTNISFTDAGGGAQTTYDGSQGITISASGGVGGGKVDVSQIDHTPDGNYYLPFFASDGFTYPFGGPTLHPNEINDAVVPEIDGFLTMNEGDSVVFTKKIPVGWRGVEIKFGLFNDDPSGSGFILAPGGQARVNVKKRLLANDNPTLIGFPPNTPFDISSTPLVNDFEEMVVVELIDPDGSSVRAYTGGGWIRIEPIP